MARKRLIDVEADPEPVERKAPPPQTGLRRNVSEVAVRGATRLLTVDVKPMGDCFESVERSVPGAIVRLRPVGPVTADDMRWAEERAEKLGALRIVQMPIAAAGATFETPQDEELAQEDDEGDVLTMRGAMCGRLESAMANAGCDPQEVRDTLDLANQMLERAGG